jgi:signal transduction histidine kinase
VTERRRLRRRLALLIVAATALSVVDMVAILTSDHVEQRGIATAIGLFTGASFVGIGAYAWWRRPSNRFGALMMWTGFAWLLPWVQGSDSPVMFTVGVAFSSLWAGAAIHMLLAYPSGRVRDRRERQIVVIAYVLALGGQIATQLFFDPQASPHDCEGCPDNLLLITPDGFDIANAIVSFIAVPFIIVVAVRLIRRWRRATPVQRRALGPVLLSGALLAANLALLLATQASGAPEGLMEGLNLLGLVLLAVVPWAFLVGLLRSWVSRTGAVPELVERLSDAPAAGEMRTALADALGDPQLTVAYWLPESSRFVDSDGRPVELPLPGSGRVATEIDRDGRPIAAIVHDDALLEEPDAVRAAGAAAALALENERLEAELRARIGELREQRQALFEVGLRERRRLERDLHDGAQQRLVALSVQLRLARARLAKDPATAEELLAQAQDELALALEELRDLARGIHPAVLTDRGLSPALEALAGRLPVEVEVTEAPDERLPGPVEAAAYFVVAEALTNVVKYSEAGHATVRVARENGQALIEVADDGIGGADPARGSGLQGLAARVAVLDGRFDVHSPPGQGTIVRVEIPCG